ncbi:hypothetical protein A9R00_09445 [Oleispira antarctica]|uniref:Uncharacterized protein n=1 Tax=Oleispira antarctica TaxID=188908 RepID=A0A1Y5HXK9_OLEAN|nr:hypothetical protein A9R00_09445 [Oleispira antarctica]
MNLDKVRTRPFLLLMISDAVDNGLITPAQMANIESLLVDMSLKIAKSFYSPVISHDLKKACSIVMGVTTLGLLKLSEGDTLKAQKILLEDTVITCFRKGWENVDALFKAHGPDANRAILLTNYQYNASEHKDIVSIHAALISMQLDVKLLQLIAAKFKNPLSGLAIDPLELDEATIKADVQVSIFEAMMKRHDLGHKQYGEIKSLLLIYRDKADIFNNEFSEATDTIQKKYGVKVGQRIEDWLPSIKDNFHKAFALLAFENSGPEIYISFFEQVLRGNINPTHFVHAYESLLEPERQLYPDLKMQIESEQDFKDLPAEEEADLPFDTDLISDFGDNTTIDY